MSIVSAFACNDGELQQSLTFCRQLKTLRVSAHNLPAVNDLKSDFPAQSLVSSVFKVDADGDWSFQLRHDLRGINAHRKVANLSDWRVKSSHYAAHKHHSR